MVVRLALHNACYSSVSSWFEFEIPSIGEHVQTVRVGAAVQKVWATPFVVYVPLTTLLGYIHFTKELRGRLEVHGEGRLP